MKTWKRGRVAVSRTVGHHGSDRRRGRFIDSWVQRTGRLQREAAAGLSPNSTPKQHGSATGLDQNRSCCTRS